MIDCCLRGGDLNGGEIFGNEELTSSVGVCNRV